MNRRAATRGAGVLLLFTALGDPARAAPDDAARPAADAPPAPTDRAEPPATLTVSGACPSADGLWTAISSLIAVKDLDRLSTATLEVSDLGETYRVSVRGVENVGAGATGAGTAIDRLRVYRDPARDCEHRARFAAVFIVLTLMPPDVLIDARPAPPPVAPPPAAPPVAVTMPTPPPVPQAPVRPRRFELTLAALADFAPPAWEAPQTWALGGELRGALRLGRLGIVGAVGWVPRATFSVGGLDAEETRVPFDLGLRLPVAAARRLRVDADLGLGGAVFHARGENAAVPQAGTRTDLGARLGLVLRIGAPRARLAPVVGLDAEIFPRPYDLAVTPDGMVGRTPALWIGASAGLAVAP